MRQPLLAVSLAALTCLVFAGCEAELRQREAAEAGRISRAIDVVRRAPNAQKEPPLLALKAQPCSFEDVCQAQSVCVQAYELHTKGLQSSRTARHALRQVDGGDAGADQQGVGRLVADSKRQLERAKALMNRCLAAQGALRRKFDL